MRSLFDRDCRDSKRTERRRIALAVGLLVALGVGWRGVREPFLAWLACTNVGCPARGELLAHVLRRKDLTLPEDLVVTGHALPRPGSVVGRFGRPLAPPRDGFSPWEHWAVVADHQLVVKGILATDLYLMGLTMLAPHGDADGDGRWEVLVQWLTPEDMKRDTDTYAVVRLGPRANQIAWLGRLNDSAWNARRIRVKPIWRDEDGDDRKELVFVTVEIVPVTQQTIFGPQRSVACKPPETVAVFEWESPGGVLRPRMLPPDSGVAPWQPPKGGPLEVDRNEHLQCWPELQELIPDAVRSSPATTRTRQ